MTNYKVSEQVERSWARSRAARQMVEWLRGQAAARDGDRYWYVARTRRDNADEAANEMSKAGIETWCPVTMIVKRQPRGQGCRTISAALFPRYFFVKTLAFEAAWLGVMSFDAIDCLLGNGERPAAISERIIEDIHRFCSDGALRSRTGQRGLRRGDRVMIEAGPWAFLEGIVSTGPDRSGVVDLEIDIFGRMTPCRIGVDDLKRLA